jgi:hypothetical protein
LNRELGVRVAWEAFLGVMLPGGVSESAREGPTTEGGDVSDVAEDLPLLMPADEALDEALDEAVDEVVAGVEGVGEGWTTRSLPVPMNWKILEKSPSLFSIILSFGVEEAWRPWETRCGRRFRVSSSDSWSDSWSDPIFTDTTARMA